MNNLVTYKQMLPDAVEEVADFVVVNEEKLNAVKAAIRAARKAGSINLEELERQQRELEITTVLAQCKLGELTKGMERASAGRPLKNESEPRTNLETKMSALENIGLTKQRASEYERMSAHPEVVEQIIDSGEHVTKAAILKAIKASNKKDDIELAHKKAAEQIRNDGEAVIFVDDSIGARLEEKCQLLLTDPPYSTDVEDIDQFVGEWLYEALQCVEDTGFAYVFIGAYPEELEAYLSAVIPVHIELAQVLVWTYKNTLGNNPKDRYKLNWQACLFYRGVNAPPLDCPLTSEQWAVQEINAPDGRQGDRFHPWQKPMEIAERFIRHTTKPGDIVYDPFSGSGTFVLAAAKLGRRGIGFEVNEDTAMIAEQRGVTLCRTSQ